MKQQPTIKSILKVAFPPIFIEWSVVLRTVRWQVDQMHSCWIKMNHRSSLDKYLRTTGGVFSSTTSIRLNNNAEMLSFTLFGFFTINLWYLILSKLAKIDVDHYKWSFIGYWTSYHEKSLFEYIAFIAINVDNAVNAILMCRNVRLTKNRLGQFSCRSRDRRIPGCLKQINPLKKWQLFGWLLFSN